MIEDALDAGFATADETYVFLTQIALGRIVQIALPIAWAAACCGRLECLMWTLEADDRTHRALNAKNAGGPVKLVSSARRILFSLRSAA